MYYKISFHNRKLDKDFTQFISDYQNIYTKVFVSRNVEFTVTNDISNKEHSILESLKNTVSDFLFSEKYDNALDVFRFKAKGDHVF
ncbi:hypothetical protein [Tenacibaculum sp. 190524A02b]|uniref:Uncharacterized protein n=1 Tax=Tenacibaculum vairaonense TaxID=3137860 RepID=A0ABM9PKW1_9FLAO